MLIVGPDTQCRRRGAPNVDLSTLPPEEIARRARQRELRLMALKLQSEGKVYNPQRAKLKKSHKPRRAVQVILYVGRECGVMGSEGACALCEWHNIGPSRILGLAFSHRDCGANVAVAFTSMERVR